MPNLLDHAVASLPRAYAGPGGACAVLQDGQVLVRHAWGFANAERRIPFTPRTLFRMCSITKQFTCATLLDLVPDPSALDTAIAARLPHLQQPTPSALNLCHNQSGLRDYWAVAMLLGAPAESPFGDTEATRLTAATLTLQFTPGTRYSYVNQNFRILSDILQDRTGHTFADLLRTRVFASAGMETAFLAADTRAMPDGAEGYEGTQATGFRAAENRIVWTGDAGLGASLDDMIAWEQHIDATRDDPASLYRRLSTPTHFADGAAAPYGFGLGRRTVHGRPITGHGGALRGWRSHRLHAADGRISVVVLFNHMSDAQAAALALLAATLGKSTPPAPAPVQPPSWLGAYIEPETGLAVRIDLANGQPRLRYGHGPERLDLQPDGTAGTDGTRLVPTHEGLRMDRPQENQSTLLRPIPGAPSPETENAIEGRYRCAELDADLTIAVTNGTPYAAFSGPLGQSRMELLDPIGPDTWALPCPRALDHTPPGDWTLAITRTNRQVSGLQLGCWLARRLRYDRL